MFTTNNKKVFERMAKALKGKSRFDLTDIDFMRNLYINERIGTPTIAAMMGCSQMNVKNLLKRRGVKIRRPSKVR